MSKLKVLMITGGLGHEGISHCIMNYLLNIKTGDVQIDLCVAGPYNQELIDQLKKAGITCYTLPSRNQQTLKYFFEEIYLIRKNHYQIVHINGNSATMAIDLLGAWLGGCKIRIAHSHNSTCTHINADKLLRPLFYMLCTHGFACSKLAGDWLFKDGKYTVVENAVPFDNYSYDPEARYRVRKSCKIGVDNFVFGHIGCFNEQKNHSFLLEVFHQFCQKEYDGSSRLLLVGEGSLMEQIKEKADSLGIADKVIFYGTTNHVADVLSAMDLFVFPSIFEGLGIVMLEAQLNGLPCLASDRVPQVVKISSDCSFIPLTTEEWLEAIDKVSVKNDRSFKRTQQADRFDITVQARKLQDIYMEMVGEVNV